MKVIVFGAAGKTGRLLVDKALAAGHEVTAFVRDPSRFPVTHERLKVVKGDAMKLSDVEEAVKGHDAAIHAVGSGDMGKTTLRTDTARNVVAACEKHGVARVIAMSGMGAGESYGSIGLIGKLIFSTVFKNLLVDQNGLEAEVRKFPRDWILVRPAGLADKPPKGKVKPTPDGKGNSFMVPREAVAEFMIEQLTSDAWVKKAPALSA
jgi:putative NADH-flavin reductase